MDEVFDMQLMFNSALKRAINIFYDITFKLPKKIRESILSYDMSENTLSILVILLSFFLSTAFVNNSKLNVYYHFLQNAEICLGCGNNMVFLSLKDVINDILLGMIFFLMGLEVKDTYTNNVVAVKDQLSCAIFASVIGIFLSMSSFYLINSGEAHFGLSTAGLETDSAAILFVLRILRGKLPGNLISFICLITMVDDVFSICVFNYFNATSINYIWLVIGILMAILVCAINVFNIKAKINIFVLLFIGWLSFEVSGLHGTIIAMCIGLLIPKQPKINIKKSSKIIGKCWHILSMQNKPIGFYESNKKIKNNLEDLYKEFKPSASKIKEDLEWVVNFVMLPIFIFINSGILINKDIVVAMWSRVSLAIFFSLVIAKCFGIVMGVYFSIKLKIGYLPQGVPFSLFARTSILFGTGLTFSIFVVDRFVTDYVQSKALMLVIIIASIFSVLTGIFSTKMYVLKKKEF